MASIDSNKVMSLHQFTKTILNIAKQDPDAMDAGVFMWGDDDGNHVFALHSIEYDPPKVKGEPGSITLFPGEELDFSEDEAELQKLSLTELGIMGGWLNADGTPKEPKLTNKER
jgi:hypothetical protein